MFIEVRFVTFYHSSRKTAAKGQLVKFRAIYRSVRLIVMKAGFSRSRPIVMRLLGSDYLGHHRHQGNCTVSGGVRLGIVWVLLGASICPSCEYAQRQFSDRITHRDIDINRPGLHLGVFFACEPLAPGFNFLLFSSTHHITILF